VTFDSTVRVYLKINKGNAKFKTKYLFLEQMCKMVSFSLNAALHIVKCVFQLFEDYLSTNISNTLTKFFDSVTCASKNCVFEVWVNKVVHYCKIWKPLGCQTILSNKQSSVICIILLKIPFGKFIAM
jgi:hypothetical protein